MRILRPLLGFLSAGKPHCDGITPIDEPRNTYFEAMWHDDNLGAAMAWLVRADRDADHSDLWHYRRDWQTKKCELQQRLKTGRFCFQVVNEYQTTDDQGQAHRREYRCAEDRLVIRAIKQQYALLQSLRVRMHPDKTFIGKIAKGVDFLGFHCHPLGMTLSETTTSRHDSKMARLYEQGASSQRIAAYRLRWSAWAFAPLLHQVFFYQKTTLLFYYLNWLPFAHSLSSFEGGGWCDRV